MFPGYKHSGYNNTPLSSTETYAILIFTLKCIETVSAYICIPLLSIPCLEKLYFILFYLKKFRLYAQAL